MARPPLFTEPCIKLGYADRRKGYAQWVHDEQLRASVWNGGGGEVHLKAWATVGALDEERSVFTPRVLDLETFLHQVLSGRRRWDPRPLIVGTGSGSWTGWLLDAEVDEFDAIKWCEPERARRECDAARRTATLQVPSAPKQVEDKFPTAAVSTGPSADNVRARPAAEAAGRERVLDSVPSREARDGASPATEAAGARIPTRMDVGREATAAEKQYKEKKTFFQRLRGFLRF